MLWIEVASSWLLCGTSSRTINWFTAPSLTMCGGSQRGRNCSIRLTRVWGSWAGLISWRRWKCSRQCRGSPARLCRESWLRRFLTCSTLARLQMCSSLFLFCFYSSRSHAPSALAQRIIQGGTRSTRPNTGPSTTWSWFCTEAVCASACGSKWSSRTLVCNAPRRGGMLIGSTLEMFQIPIFRSSCGGGVCSVTGRVGGMGRSLSFWRRQNRRVRKSLSSRRRWIQRRRHSRTVKPWVRSVTPSEWRAETRRWACMGFASRVITTLSTPWARISLWPMGGGRVGRTHATIGSLSRRCWACRPA